jgi:predicted aldo/keto reductase-like oxidoreductase
MATSTTLTSIIASSAVAAVLFIAYGKARKKKASKDESSFEFDFLNDVRYRRIVKLIKDSIEHLSGDELIKIARQLQFWIHEWKTDGDAEEEKLIKLTQRLIYAATWRQRFSSSSPSTSFKVPHVRFGRTELRMPIVTCGTMRFQYTWMPDTLPITIGQKKVLQTLSQENIESIVLQCINMGINHFETARLYGTSEIQLTHALTSLIRQGKIRRSDFILQTKVVVRPKDEFIKLLQQSWSRVQELEYIDLFSFHVVSKDEQVERLLRDDNDDDGSIYKVIVDWKKQGRIKHIGFSTHGTAENILRLINSNKFDYVNLHYHYFGSYHAEGTPDTYGGHGNAKCVERALELDMGVFNISPVDKGGRLYQPSAQVARTIGPELTPIAFAALYSWVSSKMHTVSVGFARPEDLTEILYAAELFASTDRSRMTVLLEGATSRLDELAKSNLGDQWYRKGLVNIPGPFAKETDGIGLGHTLWCYNMLHAYGMYDTARTRYNMLLNANKKWNKKKSREENIKNL